MMSRLFAAGCAWVLALAAPAVGAAPVPAGARTNVSLELPDGAAAAGFVGPGSRIDVVAVLRTGNKLEAFVAVSDLLVTAVEVGGGDNPRVTLTVVTTEKQALALALVRRRGCSPDVVLRNPNAKSDPNFDLDAVIKKLTLEVAPPPRPAVRR